ncbi:hypothetical protein ACGFIU_24885 [Rhodococcus oryzae]|uniref:hypothetical protein n=1 Tax=Rhodococcus oryzae TaxID=2571143 RepID=UPI0037181D98
MTTNHTPTDALAYILLLVRERIEWGADQIGGNIPSINASADQLYDGNTHVLDSLCDLIKDVEHIAMPHLDEATYSDGRPIQSRIELEEGCILTHLWHPDPTQETERTFPVQIRRGEAEVTITPPSTMTATITRTLAAVDATEENR